jgi:hypothetical protein
VTAKFDNIEPQITQLLWLNRNEQTPFASNIKRGSNGSLLVNQTPITVGQPIVIGTGEGWMHRSDFEALQTHNSNIITDFSVELHGKTWQVIWDNSSGPAITGTDLYDDIKGYQLLTNVTLKFLTV